MHLTTRCAAFGFLVTCAIFDAAVAQNRPTLQPGARLRVWHVGAIPRDATVGSLLLFEPAALSVVPRGALDPVTIPFANIDYLELSRGRHPLLRFGIPVVGTLLGAWIGPLVMSESQRCASGVVRDPRCTQVTPDWVVGAGGGLIVFGILGSFVGTERWLDIPLASLAPRPIASLSLSF